MMADYSCLELRKRKRQESVFFCVLAASSLARARGISNTVHSTVLYAFPWNSAGLQMKKVELELDHIAKIALIATVG